VIYALTGRPSIVIDPADERKITLFTKRKTLQLLEHENLIGLATFRWSADKVPAELSGIVPGHAYSILAYNKGTDEVLLRNPWGGTVPTKRVNEANVPRYRGNDANGEFWIPSETLFTWFWVTIESPLGPRGKGPEEKALYDAYFRCGTPTKD
jgi:hypothetical protein